MSEKLIYVKDVLKYTVLAGEIRNQYMEVVPAYYMREAPAVDAVEVVRCRQCCFGVKKRERGEVVTYCGLFWGMKGVLDPNDFCSYGKEINDAAQPYKSSNTNAAGYLDPTAAEAIKNVSEEDERVSRLIKAIKILIRLAGFEPVNRLELKSKETGRIYR